MKCPNCGGIVREIDILDSNYIDNEYYDIINGICSKCGKIWRWKEVYIFSREDDIHEIKLNDHL